MDILRTILITLAWVAGISAALFAFLLFLLFPAGRKHPGRSMFGGKFIAHRGLHGGETDDGAGNKTVVPENSGKAFCLAMANGFPIETDVHITKDGKVAVFHDDTLERMCGVKGKPEELTLSELKELKLAGTEEQIMSLEELLELVGGRVPLLIELKCTDSAVSDRLCPAAAKILDNYKGEYAIQSFFPFAVGWFRKNRPDVMRGQLACGFYKSGPVKFALGMLLFNVSARPDFVSYDIRNKRNFFFRLAVRLGAMPIGWTFRKKEELEESRKYYRAYIFENLETVR